MPSLRSSLWILGAPHNGLAMLISRISRRIFNGTVGHPQRRHDFQRQYDLKPPRCQRITASGRTIASASYILGSSRQTPPNISLSIEMNGGLLELDDRFHKTDHNSTFVESDQARISQGHLTTSVPANIRFEPRKRPTSSSQHIDLLPQHQNLCLKRNSRPKQVDDHPEDQFAQI
jgi:hypothetical protein